ncbi:hypothetical protein [Hymenobacter convexus]|uniref:hypothetical protein n=1 Tax=Hymenobacter sp. CA1UV-4 TaxID=3063782 RepID=UPI002712F75D|nr:hypothetical protein [Hymenobacter sp. CA1UV-4]MDO7850998.1 hypothetical protein [Hymenobacter sp. CA1UV-4]
MGLLLLANGAARAQNIAPGYVVTVGLDSLRGGIILHDNTTQQRAVDFIPMRGNQRLHLDATQLKAYGYIHQQDTARYVSLPMNLGTAGHQTELIFLRQLVAGPVEMYRYHYSRDYYAARPATASSPVLTASLPRISNVAHPLLATPQQSAVSASNRNAFPPLNRASAQSGSGVSLLLNRRAQPGLLEVTSWAYPADAAAYFAGCPALADDLRAKRYRARDLQAVVRRYNVCASPAKP